MTHVRGGHVVAALLLPEDGTEAGRLWRCPALRAPAPLGAALGHAVRREATLVRLRLPGRSAGVGQVHRLPPAGNGRRARRLLLGGALAELEPRQRPVRRIIDVIAEEAGGFQRVGSVRPVAGGGVVVRARSPAGSECILRVGGTVEHSCDVAAAVLPQLVGLGLPVPCPVAAGTSTVEGWAWSVEQLVPGRTPTRLGRRLLDDVLDVIARFPPSRTRRAILDDLDQAAQLVPSRADAVAAVRSRVASVATTGPGVLRHGDLWLGNLLAQRGRLAGVVDWDAVHRDGVPGADLLQLVVTADRHRRRRPLGAAWRARPWAHERWRRATSRYWSLTGIDPTPELLDLAAVSWWAAEISGTLRRYPERATDEAWLATNVDAVIEEAVRLQTSRW